MFLKNGWYVAAWSEEIVNTLQQVKVLGEKICMFRNDEGEVIANEASVARTSAKRQKHQRQCGRDAARCTR